MMGIQLELTAAAVATRDRSVGRERRRGIDRVIMLLEALLKQRAPMSPGDIARAIDAPRSTTYEIVNRLVEAEMLDYSGPAGRVYFGRAMHLFGWAYSHHDAHYRRLVETLDRLAVDSAATAQLCGLRGTKYVVLDCRHAPGPFRITSEVGAEVPIPWTASGRLLLAHLSDDEIRAFVPAEDYRLPDGRLLSLDSFLADVEKARQQGFCTTAALADRFTLCMAAPIRDARGSIRTTLCLVLPIDTPDPRRVELTALLCERARSVSLATG
jgi:DNA-binding IclR family transcriptional regulator